MAKEFSDIGNGNGLIYVTGPDGLATSMNTQFPNNSDGVREAKSKAVQAAATSANLIANGKLQFTAISGVLNVTGLIVAGIQQMANSVNVTGLNEAQTAAAVSQEVNSTTPASGINYTAAAIDDTVFLFATSEDGSTPNGDTVAFTTDDPGNITADPTDVANGADANSIFDEAHGFRFFLDADYLASSSSCTGEGTAQEGDISNAIEITNDIITTITTIKKDEVEIVAGGLTTTRQGKVYSVEVNTEASAPTDDLITINPAGHSEGDIIEVRGVQVGRVVTLKETGNIDLAGGTDFTTGAYERVITLQLWAKGGPGLNELFWFEVSRSTQGVPSITDLRASNPPIPHVSTEGLVGIIPATTGGTIVRTINVDEALSAITGGPLTLTSNLIIEISTVGAVKGDVMGIGYAAKITIGPFAVRIGGTSNFVNLTPKQAFSGGWAISSYFDGVAWSSSATPVVRDAFSGDPFQIEEAFLLNDEIGPSKVTVEMRTELIPTTASFDTDEIGDHKIVMPFAGTIVGIDYAVDKDIQAANDGSVVAKNNAAAVMATTTVTSGSPLGTIFSESPSSNNTFVAGDIITFTTSKSTAGGKVKVSIKVIRT